MAASMNIVASAARQTKSKSMVSAVKKEEGSFTKYLDKVFTESSTAPPAVTTKQKSTKMMPDFGDYLSAALSKEPQSSTRDEESDEEPSTEDHYPRSNKKEPSSTQDDTSNRLATAANTMAIAARPKQKKVPEAELRITTTATVATKTKERKETAEKPNGKVKANVPPPPHSKKNLSMTNDEIQQKAYTLRQAWEKLREGCGVSIPRALKIFYNKNVGGNWRGMCPCNLSSLPQQDLIRTAILILSPDEHLDLPTKTSKSNWMEVMYRVQEEFLSDVTDDEETLGRILHLACHL